MLDVDSWLLSLGISGGAVLDGKIHRVARQGNRGKNAWYIGWQDPFVSCIAGDWRTGEKWEYRENKVPLTARERQDARIKVRLAMAESERERERRRELVALQADITLRSAATTGEHPYLERKRVGAFGLYFMEGEILLPVRDLDGRTWGYERILADGKKLFLPGQRVEGCFHRIAGDPARIIIAEGYATGASIHMATGATVLCAYHAGNLKEVSRQAHLNYPKATITVAGDDDQWTAGNPGKTKALDAALRVGGRVVLPVFTSLEGKPTDFNDLHCRDGLETVRAQLAVAEL